MTGRKSLSVARKADVRRAAQAALQMLENTGITAAPIDPFAIAADQGIDVKPIRRENIEFSGCLVNANGGWGVLYRDDIPVAGFKRFTVAHELGHYELTEHHGVIFSGGTHVSESGFVSHQWYEQEADHFASELLMPTNLFTAAIRGKTIGLPAIKALAAEFQTSLTSTAIRYAQLTSDPVAILVSRDGRIRYCFTSTCLRSIRASFIERATPVPTESVTHRMNRDGAAAGSERQGTSYASTWFDQVTREIEFNEDVIDLGRYGRTLTVLHAVELPGDDLGDSQSYDDGDDGGLNPDGKRYRW